MELGACFTVAVRGNRPGNNPLHYKRAISKLQIWRTLNIQRLSMASSKESLAKNHSARRLKRQKQYRRRANIMKKAWEYSKLCNADVCVGIRMRETGQVHVLSVDASGFWAFLNSQLVRNC